MFKVSVLDDHHLSIVFSHPARTTALKMTLSSTKLSWCTGISVHGIPAAGTVTSTVYSIPAAGTVNITVYSIRCTGVSDYGYTGCRECRGWLVVLILQLTFVI